MAPLTTAAAAGLHPDGLEPGGPNFPDYCSRAINQPFGKDYLRDRHDECLALGYTAQVGYYDSNGVFVPEGTAKAAIFIFIQLNATGRRWVVQTSFKVVSADGPIASGITLDTSLLCSTNCTVTTSTPSNGPTFLATGQDYIGSYGVSNGGSATRGSTNKVHIQFLPPSPYPAPPPVDTPATSSMRCDSVSYVKGNGGCVFNGFIASWKPSKSASDIGKSAQFIEFAQNNTPDEYGKRGHKPLTRQFPYPSNARDYACAGFEKRYPNDSCDEYPFNSTFQNALKIGRNRAAVGHVPLDDNRNAGAQLGAWYDENRILNKDKFYVEVQS